MPYLGFSSVFNIPMEQSFLPAPGEILNKIKNSNLYYQVLPIEQKLQGSGFTFVLFLLCLHSLEVSCSQRQVLVARDL